MNPALLIRLRPITPWRIGPDHGAMDRSATVLHSDAVYSALTLAFSQLGWLEEWLNATAREHAAPAVRLSSGFPYQRGLLFAPPPAAVWPPAGVAGKTRWKAAKLVPVSVIAALLRGEAFDEKAWQVDAHSGCLLPAGGRFPTGPFRPMLRTAAAVDRVSGNTVLPWKAGCLQFAPGAGVWCAAEFASPTAYAVWAPKLQAAFRLLADSGVGGLRSRGFGRSRVPEFQSAPLRDLLLPGIEIPSVDARASEMLPRAWWMLSLFAPADTDTVRWDAGEYALVERSGRAVTGQLKKSSRLVREGSLVVADTAPTGRVHDVAPEGSPHEVWRAGYAVALELPGVSA